MASPFAAAFSRCAPLISRSLASEGHSETLDDVWARIAAGRAQLWEGEGACAVTEVAVDTVAGPVLTLWIVSGDLAAILAMLPGCEAWARTWGVREVRFAPRRQAWARILSRSGYRALSGGVFGKELLSV